MIGIADRMVRDFYGIAKSWRFPFTGEVLLWDYHSCAEIVRRVFCTSNWTHRIYCDTVVHWEYRHVPVQYHREDVVLTPKIPCWHHSHCHCHVRSKSTLMYWLCTVLLLFSVYELRSSKFFRLIRRVVDYFLDYTEGTLYVIAAYTLSLYWNKIERRALDLHTIAKT
jgi:hypothetical protein